MASFFLHSNAEDRPVFLQVFPFKVCADPFAPLGSGGGQELHFFKAAVVLSQHLLYLLEILNVVSCNSELTIDFQAAKHQVCISGAN